LLLLLFFDRSAQLFPRGVALELLLLSPSLPHLLPSLLLLLLPPLPLFPSPLFLFRLNWKRPVPDVLMPTKKLQRGNNKLPPGIAFKDLLL
jgi:hypothetical protein